MLERRRSSVRPAAVVMRPDTLGAARLTRYSFSRMMLRRASTDRWLARRTSFQIDAQGRGESIYRLDIGDAMFHFVAFTTTIDESEHTDRVVANRWEITAALAEGELTDDLLELLRSEVPKQEDGRLDSRVLVLTRGNRSVRFFQYLVDALARGEQPEPDEVADAGYIMRSTAFYGNGKCGVRSFEGYSDAHPLNVPFRAQFVAAWLFRELSYDLVEHCARARGGDRAALFDQAWRRYFGLGNATGLGLVPYALHHPRVINAWAGVRELALADVRTYELTAERAAALEWWIRRAHRHFDEGTDDDCHPFTSTRGLAPKAAQIGRAFAAVTHRSLPFDELYRWAADQDVETTELVVSLLIELHEESDEVVDRLLRVDEHPPLDPTLTIGEVRTLLETHFGWLDSVDPEEDACWWLISDNTEEPRRMRRDRLAPDGRDVAIDVANRMVRLRAWLDTESADASIQTVLRQRPEHRFAVERLQQTGVPYGEPRDNVCAVGFLPLQLQRFQLAVYGMDNFKPKSTDWLRVTLFQGAPRLSDMRTDMDDAWVLPQRPSTAERTETA